jgi:hypothetical protein
MAFDAGRSEQAKQGKPSEAHQIQARHAKSGFSMDRGGWRDSNRYSHNVSDNSLDIGTPQV